MHLNHEFVVPVPVEQAWDVLLDIERIAPCLPGATVESVEGDSFAGRVKVKVGPITVTYKGTATFVHRDEESHRATIRADGREARGSGTAAATIEAVLHDEGDRTRVTLDTELAVTGRPAQFGRGVMVDVSNKLLGMFADCLERTLAAGQAAPVAAAGGAAEAVPGEPVAASAAAGPGEPAAVSAAAAVPGPSAAPTAGRPEAPRPTPEAIDLVEAAGGPILKRVLPAVSAVIVLVLLWRILRRIRS
ncbi:MAG TPA: SRPBCC family protein [Actinoplanes sp.]|nr:SRPBCC family protein [Actinoplanes sp.]